MKGVENTKNIMNDFKYFKESLIKIRHFIFFNNDIKEKNKTQKLLKLLKLQFLKTIPHYKRIIITSTKE